MPKLYEYAEHDTTGPVWLCGWTGINDVDVLIKARTRGRAKFKLFKSICGLWPEMKFTEIWATKRGAGCKRN